MFNSRMTALLVSPLLCGWVFLPPTNARAEDSFTIDVTWKCLSKTFVANYPCRNSTERLSSYKGGVVYLYSKGQYCDNDTAKNPNTFQLSLKGRKSGAFKCKAGLYDGTISYSGGVDWNGDDLRVAMSGKWATKFSQNSQQLRQDLNFSYAAKFVIRDGKCFATKNYRFSAQMQSVPGPRGSYEYTATSCTIGK